MTATAGRGETAQSAGIDARGGDWDELVARFAPYVHAVAVRAYGLPERDAQAAFEEVFLRLWVQFDTWPADGASARGRVAAAARDVAAEHAPPGTEPPPAEVLRELDDALRMRDAMAALEAVDRDLLDRCLANRQSEAQVAEALGIPVETVAGRVRAARERLREELGWLT